MKGEGMPQVADSKLAEVHLGAREEADPVERDPDRPFRILLAGDFSGRAWRDSPRRFTPQLLDRDNFDEVLEGMKVSLNLHGVTLSFHELEDFHPDRIYRTVPLFQSLDRHLDRQEPAQSVTPAPAAPPAASSGSLLDQMLAEQEEPAPPSGVSLGDADDLSSFIKRITHGHLEPRPDPSQQQRAARREALATELLQGFLHHPHMQAIEAAWRALFMLIRGLETDGNLKLYVLDITLPELIADIDAVQRELRRKGPWAVIAGNYTFGQSELDALVLHRLAGLGRSLGAPFIAEAQLPGGATVPAWNQLRHCPEARWIGLALPRFLLRLPYGKATDSIESFPFEEMPESDHGAYLWGNPAFVCAYLLGQSFLARGWELTRLERRIDGLPMHVYRQDGEPVAKPCAEILMTERDALSLLDAGFMPLASLKHEPAAILVRFQSIAEPLAPLAGLA
jgi:type VI secretion system protein ImpC